MVTSIDVLIPTHMPEKKEFGKNSPQVTFLGCRFVQVCCLLASTNCVCPVWRELVLCFYWRRARFLLFSFFFEFPVRERIGLSVKRSRNKEDTLIQK